MRTTVTLDDDVERLLREAMARKRKSFKQTLNDAVRRGLKEFSIAPEPPFRVKPQPLHLRRGIDAGRLSDLDHDMEIERHLRVTREMEQESP